MRRIYKWFCTKCKASFESDHPSPSCECGSVYVLKNEPIQLPFERLPVCACDPGIGPKPARQQTLECELRGGPCSPNYTKHTMEEGARDGK